MRIPWLRDIPYEPERDRAEEVCDANQDAAMREIDAALAVRTCAEVEAEAMRAFEDGERLKYLPSRRWLDREER